METAPNSEHGRSAEAAAANEAGKAHIRADRRAQARSCFAEAVALDPGFAEAHNNLANALAQAGDHDGAITHYQRAIVLRPDYPEAQYNLGNASKARDGDAAALPAYRAAAALRPDFVEAHYALAGCLHRLDRPAEAAAAYRAVVVLRPDAAEAHNNLGAVLRQRGDRDGALAAFDRACILQPSYAIAQSNRGSVLADLHCHETAIGVMLHALGLDPANREILARLCQLLRSLGRLVQAIAVCRAFVGQNPEAASGHVMLAELLRDTGELDAAEDAVRRALTLEPDLAAAHMVAGNIRSDQGDLEGALSGYRRALDLEPNDIGARNALLFMMQFASGVSPAAILAEARLWAALHEAPLLAQARDAAADVPARPRSGPLTIGYVSPYFRRHSAAAFLLPLLAHHDRERVRVICYADVRQPDAITQRLRGLGHLWRDIAGYTDAELADHVRTDGVDVLVDTALHMEGSRLLAFARRPAPTQVTWLGYPGTTGLSSIDYRLTDPLLDPVGGEEPYAEATVRLPRTFWCYAPMIETPEVSPLPALARGHLTFCFNNFRKVTLETLALWAEVLTAIPTAHLHLLCEPGRHRERMLGVLREAGVAGDRIRFIGRQPLDAYYALYREVDIGLDTTPYAGHTTTLDSLWMGVPVASLCGPTVVGRGGLSILTNAGLPELVARDRGDFVARVLRLGRDLDGLATLRKDLRARLQTSPLMDAPAFARGMEEALIALADKRPI